MEQPEKDALRIDRPPQTLREIVLARMRAAIIAGRFPSGARLVERTLCDQLGVSRSVVREVIRILEAEGLVESLPNRGPVVARLDWAQARQIYDIRLLLEGSAAAACAGVADAGVKAELAAALAAIRAAQGATDAVFEATTRFYEIIFTAAGHAIAWEIVQRLNGRISRLRALTLAATDRPVAGPDRMARIAAATRYSWQGLRAAWRHEAAFRQEVWLGVPLLVLAWWGAPTRLQALALSATVALVWIVELLNSALEALADAIDTGHHPLLGRAKDLGSAAVLASLVLCALSYAVVFLPVLVPER